MPTRQEILAAFNDSKAHWLRLATNSREPEEDATGRDCAFCVLLEPLLEHGCECCPLFFPTSSGESSRCCGGKYFSAVNLLPVTYNRKSDSPEWNSPQFKAAAQEVYTFVLLRERDFIKKRGGKYDKRGSGNT